MCTAQRDLACCLVADALLLLPPALGDSAYVDWLAQDAKEKGTETMEPRERRKHTRKLSRKFFRHFERNAAYVCDCHGRRPCWCLESFVPLYIFLSLVFMVCVTIGSCLAKATSSSSSRPCPQAPSPSPSPSPSLEQQVAPCFCCRSDLCPWPS